MLAEVLNQPGKPLGEALADYQAERSIEVLKLQNSARNSTEWFETVERYLDFEPWQFAYSLLTRSQRISHENLRLRDGEWLGRTEAAFWQRATGEAKDRAADVRAVPAARDGACATASSSRRWRPIRRSTARPNDFHLVHYGARAKGGAGLVFTEMTCVSPTARITPGCTGMYAPEHVAAWRRITDFVHAQFGGEDLPPARPFGGQGIDPARLGDDGRAARRRQLAADRRVRRRVERGQPGAAADDPRRHGRGARPVRRRDADGRSRPGSTWSSSTPRTAICCRASSPRSRTSATMNMAAASPTACAFPWKCSRRCARRGPRSGRCRCAFRRPTGPARTG